jgi:nucleoside-diphosphate-sugar epimerase
MSTDHPQVRAQRSEDAPHPQRKPRTKRTVVASATAGTTATGETPAATGRPVAAPRQRRGGPVIAVTGAAHGVGELLVRRLTASDAVKKVIAIDTIRGDVAAATWRLVDVRDPVLADRLAGVDVVVHLALDLGVDDDRPELHASNVRGTATVLTAAPAAGVNHVVLVTSAMVYGAQPENPVPVAEDAELLAAPDSALLGELLEIERLAAQAPRTHAGLRVTVLRPAALVGGGIDTVLTRHFEAPRLLAVKGARTCWQFCHVDDLVSALAFVATGGLDATKSPDPADPGAGDAAGSAATTDQSAAARLVVAAVGCDGWLERDAIERLTGKRHIELPPSLAFGTAERLHRLGVTPASSSDLQFLVHPWVVEARRLAAHGWLPAFDNESALLAALAESSGSLAIGGHRLGRRDAAAGAAVGATVALVGTAALVRRARRRRRG